MGNPFRLRALVVTAGVLAVATAAMLLALALRVSGDDDPILPALGSSYTEAVPGTWQRVNPFFSANNPVDQDLVALVFNGLVRTGEGGMMEPDLAEGLPTISTDGRTYTFTLREGLRWHDGEPVTAEDVVFTIERVRAVDFAGDTELALAWNDIDAVELVDERRVSITLPQRSSPFLARTATLPILPMHLLDGLSSDEMLQAAFNSSPVGTGPYRLVSLTGERAELRAHDAYHLGQPNIDRLTLRFYSNFSSAVRALETGAVDGLFAADPPADAAPVLEVDGVVMVQPTRFSNTVLYLNNAQAALFQDPRVRQAISLAIDRGAIATAAFGGYFEPSASPIAPGSWAYAGDYDSTEVAIEEAEALLEDAGWVRHPTTGIRTSSGQEFRITIRTDDDPERLAVAQAVTAQLDRIGIKTTVASTTFAVLRRDFLQTRSYQAALIDWDQGPDPDPYFGWHSSQLGAAGLNIANYTDISSDFLIERGRESTDIGIRTEMYRQFQEIWSGTAPSVILGYPTYLYAFAAGVEPDLFQNLAAPSKRFANIHRWRV